MTSRRRQAVRGPAGEAAATTVRQIRPSAFPRGLPDRCDETVLEAFGSPWLLLVRTEWGTEIVGVAPDYESARAWLERDRGDAPLKGDVRGSGHQK